MAWGPEPEVAAVRTAAQKLKSPFAVLVYLDENANHLCTASYGRDKKLCEWAGKFADHLLAAAKDWKD